MLLWAPTPLIAGGLRAPLSARTAAFPSASHAGGFVFLQDERQLIEWEVRIPS